MSAEGHRMISIKFSAELVEKLLDTWSEPCQIRIMKSGDEYEMQGRTYPQGVDDGPAARLTRESLQRGIEEYRAAHPDQLPNGQAPTS